MADSDEEYDRKRRDKFQGERGDSYRSSDRRNKGNDDDWGGRQRGRNEYRDRYQYQNEMPPHKRMRYELDERRMRFMDYGGGGGGGGFGGGWDGGFGARGAPNAGTSSAGTDLETQPPMMSFKAFLQTQDDSITDEEALSKYAEYKQEFRRQQLNEFFVAHKEEEWFKLKYHPEESTKRRDELYQALKRRAEVYMDLLKRGNFEDISLDSDHGDPVIKLLDSVVILLEGGTDLDLTILDINPPAPENSEKEKKDEVKDKEKEIREETKENGETVNQEEKEKEDVEDTAEPITEDTPEEPSAEKEEVTEQENTDKEQPETEKDKEDENMDNEIKSPSNHENESDLEESKQKADENEKESKDKDEEEMDVDKEEKDEDAQPKKKLCKKKKDKDKKDKDSEDKSESEEEEDSKPDNASDKSSEDDVIPLTPRALHKTSSIFLRTISPRITKAEIEAICKKYPGFLRVSLADPQPEQHWYRRGWASFRRETDIKEICWSLNTIRVKDCELGAIVNRDLSRRVRTVSGLSALKQVILHDVKLCAKLIQELDSRSNLWVEEEKQVKEEEPKSFGLVSGNPILQGITDYLVDEASAEEEELLGQSALDDLAATDRVNKATFVLDKMLLYLRIVHSVDFYNQSHYPNEDEMPNRCGIMHLRGTPTNTEKVTQQEVQEYTESFRTKLEALLLPPRSVDDAEMVKLGAKSKDTEVDKFVIANTQELAKDKWLCPLSGKKFKGPEFVRKHIFNKFSVELEEVRKEVDYFNNYLRDPKRPQLAEHPGNRGKKDPFPEPYPHQFQYGGFRGGRGHFGAFPRGGRGFLRGRGMDYRPIITYRDLDAPCEPEEII